MKASLIANYLPVESGTSHFMEPLLEDHLVVFHAGELEEDSSSSLCEGETSFELHLLTDGRGFLHAEAVGGGQEEGALGQEVLRVRDVGLTLSALHQSVNLFLPHV